MPATPGLAALIPARAVAPPGRGGHGAIYLAGAPSRGHGLAVGQRDRAAAHREAELACRAGGGDACRLTVEFTERCGAVAHALRVNAATLPAAAVPTTVMAATGGTGASREEAERQALSACAQRGRGLACEVTASRCAG